MSKDRRQKTLEGVLIPLKSVPAMIEEMTPEEVKTYLLEIIEYGKQLNADIEAEPHTTKLTHFAKIAFTITAEENALYAENRKLYNDSRAKIRNEAGKNDTENKPPPTHKVQHMLSHDDICEHMTTHDNICPISYPILPFPSPQYPSK